MRTMTMAAVVVMAAACGPVEGQQCTGELICEADGRNGLFCEGGILAKYECPGGCTTSGQTAICQFTNVKAGTFCPVRNANQAFCEGSTFVKCEARQWTRKACPGGCVQTTQVECRP